MNTRRRSFFDKFFPQNTLAKVFDNQISPPSKEIVALNRMTFGATKESTQRVKQIGLEAYIEEQLHPQDAQDTKLNQILKDFTLETENEKGRKERFPFKYLYESVENLWKLREEGVSGEERERPVLETLAATWLRALHSKWQLREVLVEFWHNHFNVSFEADDLVAFTFPVYDREVIRKHCLGNFRAFLEEVAKSTAMQYYLDNVYSRASPANENYARELFELHTLGADNYLNHLYDRWQEVPGAKEGKPVGYIDEDVYEAARAFTGWTIANGPNEKEEDNKVPNTGDFLYYDGWHDNYQKRVLGTEIPSNQSPMADGRKVLDLVAFHPATARFLSTKLCRRFIADEPPKPLIDKITQVWIKHQKSPDQIRQVVKAILTSPEFTQNWGQKVKRPLELLTSFCRALQLDDLPPQQVFELLAYMGYKMFHWDTPTGHPDVASYWVNSNMMLSRWNSILAMIYREEEDENPSLSFSKKTPASAKTPTQITDFWIHEVLHQEVSTNQRQKLVRFLAMDENPDQPLTGSPEEKEERIKSLIALLGMMPEFQKR
ncbi:hypothetical protein BKI52_22160 [marine bacterium AO1-C]|nr:hypothetical protein BKI52_22160 [marine bacterium AO1-C]